MGYYPTCKKKHRDCFANESGLCKCLGDTNFKEECPFYKKDINDINDINVPNKNKK